MPRNIIEGKYRMKLFNKKILLISEFCRQNIFVKAILVNLVYMMGTVLVFKPFLSITDYQEWETIAGAYTGETDYHTKFVQFWYAKIIMFLTNVNADIPWYSVVYYLLIFISLSAITVLILKGNDRKIVWIIINLLLLNKTQKWLHKTRININFINHFR